MVQILTRQVCLAILPLWPLAGVFFVLCGLAPGCRSALAAEGATPHSVFRWGTVTGQKLPHFASFRSDIVNLRRGPGTRYPIEWVYHRRLLPVEVLREFQNWRLVRTHEGTTGWVYHALLSNHRSFLVTGGQVTLRHAPHPDARAVAHLQQGVVGHLLHCAHGAAWCEARADGIKGYLPRVAIWGSYPDEAVDG